MADSPRTVYANTVNIRVTPRELVFEFGAHFPDRPNQAPPSDYQPEVRVVLLGNTLQGIANVLNQALAQRQQQTATAEKKPTPGFQGPSSGKPS